MTVHAPEIEYLSLDQVSPYEENRDPDRRTHYINPPSNLHIWRPGMEVKEIVDIARMTGQPVVALCGYTWVPKHDPDKFEMCEACVKIAGEIMAADG